MRIKQSVLDAIRLMSASEVAREIGCTETNIYYQIKAKTHSREAIEGYAELLGREPSEIIEGSDEPKHNYPFDEWLIVNVGILPRECFNPRGKVLISEAKKLWLKDIS